MITFHTAGTAEHTAGAAERRLIQTIEQLVDTRSNATFHTVFSPRVLLLPSRDGKDKNLTAIREAYCDTEQPESHFIQSRIGVSAISKSGFR